MVSVDGTESKPARRGMHKGVPRRMVRTLTSMSIIVLLLVSGMASVFSATLTETSAVTQGEGTVYTVDYVFNLPEDEFMDYNEWTQTNQTVTIKYYGKAVAEYNPQKWNGFITGTPVDSNGEATSDPGNWLPVTSYVEGEHLNTRVFTGWTADTDWNIADGGEGEIDPGDDLTELFSGDTTEITLVSTWSNASSISFVSSYNGWTTPNYLDIGHNIVGGSKYTNIVVINADLLLEDMWFYETMLAYDSDTSPFTLCSQVGQKHNLSISGDPTNDWDQEHLYAYLANDLIVDNVNLVGYQPGNAGLAEDEPAYALFANGHQLIIGANVTCSKNLTVYGGTYDVDLEGVPNGFSTDVRIFSGTYYNIVGGSLENRIGSGTTNVVIAGDTSTTKVNNTVYGGSIRGNDDSAYSTNVLIVGGKVDNGRFTETIAAGHSDVVGGSRYDDVNETRVVISNLAEVFAVQGGGRAGGGEGEQSRTESTDVVVSGRAKVTYMVCGSVTDGNDGTMGGIPVGSSSVTISDRAEVGPGGMNSVQTSAGYGSVFGGGWDTYTNPVDASTVTTSVTIEGGTVHGSVYGGGFRGTVGLDTNLGDTVKVVITGGIIEGSVYGGGKGGVDPVASEAARGNTTGSAYVYGDISIDIEGAAVGGSVYGGGQGVAKADGDTGGKDDVGKVMGSVSITIGPGAGIGGDVFGGGFGAVPGENILDGDRVITINGGTVGGSVYGGSRNGDDGDSGDVHHSKILLVAGKVSGSVFGGGFQGTSNMNSEILFGTPAVVEAGDPHVDSGASSPSLEVGSIYGGGNIAGGEPYSHTLLTGDARIEIGSGAQGSFEGYMTHGGGTTAEGEGILIAGEVYGQGNYTLVGGSTSVIFDGYEQYGDHPMLSVQRADSLSVSGSHIALSGSADGETDDLSHPLSLSRIGAVTLEGGAVLELMAETFGLGGFTSNVNGNLSTEGDCSEPSVRNEVVLHGGVLLLIQDEDGSGSTVSGYTLLSRPDGESYYGAFAVGSAESDDVTAGFMTDGGGTRVGVIESGGLKTWYLSGHTSFQRVMSFGPEGYADAVDVTLPRLSGSSSIAFTGMYLVPTVRDGLYLASESDYSSYISAVSGGTVQTVPHSSFAEVTVGDTALRSHTFDGADWTHAGSSIVILGSDSVLRFDGSLLSHPDIAVTGEIGTAVIHFQEVILVSGVWVPVNHFDVELRMFAEPSGVEITLVIMTEPSDSGHSGTGYLVLPAIGNAYDYSIEGTGLGGLSFTADRTFLGYSGWVESEHSGSPLAGEQADGVVIGTAGYKQTAIRVDYAGENSERDYEFQIVASGSQDMGSASGTTVTYTCRVVMVSAGDVTIDLWFQAVGSGGDKHAALTGDGTETSPYEVEWVDEAPEGGSAITIPYGSSFDSVTVWVDAGDGAQNLAASEAVLAIIGAIPSDIGGTAFDYGSHLVGLFVGDNEFNTGSSVWSDITIEAVFGITVSFDGEGIAVVPSEVVVTPGQSLHGSGYYNLDETPSGGGIVVGDGIDRTGYEAQYWSADGEDRFDFGVPLTGDVILRVVWSAETFRITVDIQLEGADGQELSIPGGATFGTTVGLGGSEKVSDVQYSESGSGSVSVDALYGTTATRLTVSIPGFADFETDVVPDGSKTVEATLAIVVYTIQYIGLDGGAIEPGEGSVDEWTVLDSGVRPKCVLTDGTSPTAEGTADGGRFQIWFLDPARTDMFAGPLEVGLFGDGTTLTLYVLEPLEGDVDMDEPESLTVILQEGDVDGTHRLQTGAFDGRTVTFTSTAVPGASVVCSSEGGILTLEVSGVGEGTGCLVLSSANGDTLTLYVFAEPHSGGGSHRFMIT